MRSFDPAARAGTPRLSVVLPVFGVADCLAECLDSVLGQSPQDVEVVAIDDCSPDGCGAILDAYAARDHRLRVIHLSYNVGLGEARNLGVQRARGAYVWFVDADDRLAEGGMSAVLDRLAAVRPDVLIVDFAYFRGGERLERHPWRRVFRDPPAETFRLVDRPELLNAVMASWNKIVRRGCLRRLGLTFGAGFYEDIAVTYPLLLAAERLALLDRVCYHYRRGRARAISQTMSPRHFDVFEEYDQIFAFMEERGAGELTDAVFNRTVRHGLTILATRGLLPEPTRAAFFHDLAEHFEEHRPPGYRRPRGLRGLQYALVDHDAYRAYTLLQPLNRARIAMRRRARAAARRAGAAVGRLRASGRTALRIAYYRACMMLPLDRGLVVYAAYWFGGYDCNPRAVYEKARELAPGMHGVWVVRRDMAASVPAGVDLVVAGSWRQLRVMARAGVLVNNVNFPHHIPKRRGSLHVQTQHGTPLKTVGFDLREFPVAAGDLNFERLAEHCERWDVLVSPNPHSSEVWRRAYPGRYRILEVGYPRNDLLVNAAEEQIASIRTGLDIKPEQVTVLYAPTHRDGQARFQPQLDLPQWAKELGPGHTLMVRAHYFYRGSLVPGHQGRHEGAAQILDVTGHPDVRELCLAADVLVTDYSAIMFDYAVLGRPIVIFAPDWESYVRTRGVYFNLLEEAPGAVATTPEELTRILTSRSYESDSAREALDRFRNRFCPHDDGHAAERVVRQVLQRYESGQF